MESTICLLTEWTLKAGGHFKTDSMFLIKKGACADGCFSREAVSMASLVFCKGICMFISGNSSLRFYFIKEGVGLRFSDRIQNNFRRSPWTW